MKGASDIISLKWTPSGKRKPGRPKDTWKRTIEKEMKAAGYDLNNSRTTLQMIGADGETLLPPYVRNA